MKIRAGLELNGRNPRQEPKSMPKITVLTISPFRSTTIISERDDIAETPQASPSSPSMKLMAFVSPAIQRTVSGMLRYPR